jgi:hypothetical protein
MVQVEKDNWSLQSAWLAGSGQVSGIRVSVRAASDAAAKEMDVMFSVSQGALALDEVTLVHDPDAAKKTFSPTDYTLPER